MEQLQHQRTTSLHQTMRVRPRNSLGTGVIQGLPSACVPMYSPFQQTCLARPSRCPGPANSSKQYSHPSSIYQNSHTRISLSSLWDLKLCIGLSLLKRILQQLWQLRIIHDSLTKMIFFSLSKCHLTSSNQLIMDDSLSPWQHSNTLEHNTKGRISTQLDEKQCLPRNSNKNLKKVANSQECDIVDSVVEQLRRRCQGFEDFYGFYQRAKRRSDCGFKYVLSLIKSYSMCSKIQLTDHLYHRIKSYVHKKPRSTVKLRSKKSARSSEVYNSSATFGNRETSYGQQPFYPTSSDNSMPCFRQRRKAKTIHPIQSTLPHVDYYIPNNSFHPRTTLATSKRKISFLPPLPKHSTKSLRNSIGFEDLNRLCSLKITHQFDLNLNTETPERSHGQVKDSIASTCWKTSEHHQDNNDHEKDMAELGVDLAQSNLQLKDSSYMLITFRKNHESDCFDKDIKEETHGLNESSSDKDCSKEKERLNKYEQRKANRIRKQRFSIEPQQEEQAKDESKRKIIVKNKWSFENFLEKKTQLSKSFIELEEDEKERSTEQEIKDSKKLEKMVRVLTQSVMTVQSSSNQVL